MNSRVLLAIMLSGICQASPVIYDCDSVNSTYLNLPSMPNLYKSGYVNDLGFKENGVRCVRNSDWSLGSYKYRSGVDSVAVVYYYDHELAAVSEIVPLFRLTITKHPGLRVTVTRSGIDVYGNDLSKTISGNEYCPTSRSNGCALARAFFRLEGQPILKFR